RELRGLERSISFGTVPASAVSGVAKNSRRFLFVFDAIKPFRRAVVVDQKQHVLGLECLDLQGVVGCTPRARCVLAVKPFPEEPLHYVAREFRLKRTGPTLEPNASERISHRCSERGTHRDACRHLGVWPLGIS